MFNKEIAIIDFGSDSIPLIKEIVDKFKINSQVYSPDNFKYNLNISGVILSGSPHSVKESYLYTNLLDNLFEINQNKLPILGICFGHEIISEYLGGKVKTNFNSEHGPFEVIIVDDSKLTCQQKDLKLKIGEKISVWMDHNDSVILLPPGFKIVASSDTCPHAIIADDVREIYGIQFHPELDKKGESQKLIHNFINIVDGNYTLGECKNISNEYLF